ncbi:hypothetical protein [Anabaenopsis elenkinii]|uniref:Uncharacterized protein n=1 Tax=Anabaenopsis elenkinii CCIBt3563 TaxID=2779889 RepID=A0A7S6RCD5_9CYAN|nr:hypothetical protein [Anabaenopsis elenkinii]QOV22372.1 hypothetical protein IM676_17110 [Anabaenopsis elenkinii CCIBt3563]
MTEILSNLADGNLNLTTEFTWILIAIALSMFSGAISAMILAGKDIGYQFSATLGALFAPAGVIPAILLSFALLNLFSSY